MSKPARWRLLLALPFLGAAALWSPAAHAQAPEPAQEVQRADPAEPLDPENLWGLSNFELRMTKRAMRAKNLSPLSMEQARGLTVESIEIAAEDPLTPEDPWPDWGNLFHVTSQDDVLRREVLLRPGEPFDPDLASETARNLRGPIILAVALVLPMRGSTPDKVKILVVTKDVWSLRTNTDFLVVGETLNYLYLSLTENNLLGRHKQTGLTSLLEQDTLTVGEFYSDPRVLGSRVALGESASIILNRDSGEPEGFSVGGSVGSPLYSLRTPWGWSLGASAGRSIGRAFQGEELRLFADPETGTSLPGIFRSQSWQVQGSATRSYGVRQKRNLSFGYQLSDRRFRFGEDDAQRNQYSSGEVARFEGTLLPRSELASQVFVRYTFFWADYLVLRNFESFALPEDFRLGPALEIGLSHADPLLGSDVRFQRFDSSLAWRGELPLGGDSSRRSDLLAVSAGYSGRFQDGDPLDNEVSAAIRNHSPVLVGGRLVWRLLGVHRWENRGTPSALGGNTGLRGFESGAFLAQSYLRSNSEWRSLPIELSTLHLGAVLFYDAAGISADGSWRDWQRIQSVGLGGRFLNPVSNRIVLRFDWGFPLEGDDPFPGSFAFGFEQAF